MNIFPVGDNGNLFRVTDVFPQEIIDFCKTANWNDYSYTPNAQPNRKNLNISSCFELSNLDQIAKNIYNELQEKLKIKFLKSDPEHVGIWLDQHGYISGLHRDFDEREVKRNGYFNIPLSMQVYLSESSNNLGTKFYYNREKTQPKYFFPYELNTGYIQINDYDQWHEMVEKIGVDETRVSCYMIFPTFTQ